jgi:hypothetical protein
MDIDATTRIWNFVSQFNINGLIECGSLSTNQQINTKVEYLVYPNPLTHRLQINISGNEILIFKIFNIQGKKVLDGRLSPGTNYINTINLRQGIYFLKIKNKTIKLIKN